MTDISKSMDQCAAIGCGGKTAQRIMVLQQGHQAERKIEGIRNYGQDDFQLDVVSVTEDLPPVVDDGGIYLPEEISADIVLDFLSHLDLSEDLAAVCEKKQIPVVASGKKMSNRWVFTPPT